MGDDVHQENKKFGELGIFYDVQVSRISGYPKKIEVFSEAFQKVCVQGKGFILIDLVDTRRRFNLYKTSI